MSFQSSHSNWPIPAGSQDNGFKMNHAAVDGQSRPNPDAPMLMPEASDSTHDEDHQRRAHFANLFRKTDAKIAALFADDGDYDEPAIESLKRPPTATAVYIPPATDHTPIQQPPLKRAKRVIIDDYDDDDEDDEEEGEQSAAAATQLQNDNAAAAKTYLSPSKSGSSPVHSVSSPGKNGERAKEDGTAQGKEKSSEDARKELEEARNATEEAAKRSFHTMFYTLENDRTAMVEQQQLEESEKQIQAEMDKNGGNVNDASGQNHGSLSSANLGASSLTLKHLIARIDMKRSQVQATDQELRSLMNEVRKNRSKWASEESVGQEELYEALEKVLSELKAHTEYSTPFLTKVSKRDAPDYYSVIKQPMDLGTMTKKLKQLQYKSKADFVADLNLIWDNCLRYNQNLSNHLPRLANGMRREADKLIPLIPEIIVRPRAEVEAEERRKQNGGEDDGGDDSDDEPIITSRGRSNATKGAAKSRTAPSDQKEETPTNDAKPTLQINGILAKTGREGSEMADGSNGFGTPPVGSFTPIGPHGQSGTSNADAMEIDGPSLNGMGLNLGEAAEQEVEGEEYKIWKQVTKKDRALVARERYNIFKDNKLNPDEPAILRTKAGMRRVLRSHKRAELADNALTNGDSAANEATKLPETLAEGMEVEDDRALPDYYETSNLVPDVLPKLQWLEDDEGQVINQHEEMLRLIQPGHFVAPESILTKKFHGNLRQMQETRKVCSKIGVIKQMQIQTQVYANQFPKYEPEPFHEVDIEPHFIAGDVPVMAPDVCKAALKRSVAQIFYHAGFEELQPSALDVVTEIAGDYFGKIIHTFNVYREADKVNATGKMAERGAKFQPRFTQEEVILHALNENGHSLESIEGYAKDDVDRLGSKLGVIHDRMKSHLADLLRPALNDGGPDGAGAFKDGSDQFVGGDFAEELGEDFFGFKALGLVEELGLDMLSVPLHLLQSRVRNTYQAQTQTVDAEVQDLFDALPPTEPVTKDNIQGQIGLVKNFFLAKLHANGDQPLVEDEDLPVKQRRPRPRLGATGKIVSPQKRPPKEQIALAKKKKKLEAGKAQITDPKPAAGAAAAVTSTPEKAKKMTKVPLPPKPPTMERMGSTQSQGGIPSSPPGDNKDDIVTMLSPESTGQ